MKISGNQELNLSGTRFTVDYSISGMDEKTAREIAWITCVEQTVEFPDVLIPSGEIRDHILGKIENFEKVTEKQYLVTISYAIEITAFEILQFLNVLYGNISVAKGVRVENVSLPDEFVNTFKGPRYGLDGLREITKVSNRPLLCSPLKPMGLNPAEFGQMAYEMALGGIDIIKDDHGLSNQPFCPFTERVNRVVEGIQKANHESGQNCLYFPNITGPNDIFYSRAEHAKKTGAGGLMMLAGLQGWDALRMIANDNSLALPIFFHPAFLGGTMKSDDTGLSARVINGVVPRLAGADISAFQNFIGRLTNSKEDCQNVLNTVKKQMGNLKTCMPSTGGGMTLKNFTSFRDFYGNDILYIMGGGLHHGDSLVETCRAFRDLLEK